jgi:hypothetical protein
VLSGVFVPTCDLVLLCPRLAVCDALEVRPVETVFAVRVSVKKRVLVLSRDVVCVGARETEGSRVRVVHAFVELLVVTGVVV